MSLEFVDFLGRNKIFPITLDGSAVSFSSRKGLFHLVVFIIFGRADRLALQSMGGSLKGAKIWDVSDQLQALD